MVHQVILFVDGVHFGLAIKCADGWYKFQYASGQGAKSLVPGSVAKVTIKRSAPTGQTYEIGVSDRGLQQLINYARVECGFNLSDYQLFCNNCRHFASKLAQFLGVFSKYQAIVKQKKYWFAT